MAIVVRAGMAVAATVASAAVNGANVARAAMRSRKVMAACPLS
jgi:hypothetical protein